MSTQVKEALSIISLIIAVLVYFIITVAISA